MTRTLEKSIENTQLLVKEAPLFMREGDRELSRLEIQGCQELMQKLIGSQQQIREKISNITEKLEQRQYNKGMGYFNAKNLIFLEYLIQLEFYELFKINTIDLTHGQGLQLYQKLVYLKTLLTKLSPIQKKLEYQKNKMLKHSDLIAVKIDKEQKNDELDQQKDISQQQIHQEDSVEGQQEQQAQIRQKEGSDSEEDALAYQPRPQALMTVRQKKEKEMAKQGKYVAPKISSALSKQDKQKRRKEQQQERRKTFLIRKYRDDLMDDDQARQEGVENEVAQKIKRRFHEKTSIEEENFMRLPQTKKDRFWRKQLIRNQVKSDPLKQTLKQVQMVGEIYKKQREEEQEAPVFQRIHKKQKKTNSNKPQNNKRKIQTDNPSNGPKRQKIQ